MWKSLILENFDYMKALTQNRVYEELPEDSLEDHSSRKKHNRRTAKEITKDQICPYKNWDKKYGSEGSLNLHMKLKHGGGNKTDREKLAVSKLFCWIRLLESSNHPLYK